MILGTTPRCSRCAWTQFLRLLACQDAPCRRPLKLHADKGYDFKRCRAHLRQRGIIGRIARRGIESSERLGKHRRVVERTRSWFAGFGKLRIRFELWISTKRC